MSNIDRSIESGKIHSVNVYEEFSIIFFPFIDSSPHNATKLN